MIEHLFSLVNPDPAPTAPEVRARHGPKVVDHWPKIDPDSTKQNRPTRRLHPHMKRDTVTLVAATLRTGFLVGIALILILVLLPAAVAQAAGPR